MAEPQKHPLTSTLARQLFVAEMGHTGMSWDDLGEHGVGRYEREAGRVLEGWWDPSNPYVILDLYNDEMWLAPAAPDPGDQQ